LESAFKFGTMPTTLVDDVFESDAPESGVPEHGVSGLPSADETVDKVYKQVKHVFGTKVTAASALTLIVAVMEACEQLGAMSGPGRKKVAIEVVDRFLNVIPEDTENRQFIIASVNLLLPTIVDSVASVAKGQTNLSKKVKKTFAWCC